MQLIFFFFFNFLKNLLFLNKNYINKNKIIKIEFGCQQGFRPGGIPPIILKNCASAFAKPLSLLFNRSMPTSLFPNRWKVSYVTPIFKKCRCNNVEDYRSVAILSAIPKRLELLVYRGMYNDLKNLMSINQHGFMKNRSAITNLY
jgi:hypothetical protein